MIAEVQTHLSRLHAYPAMVEDGLAMELALQHVIPGSRVFDPFCGTGRLLFAGASRPGQFLGVDVNPLACLVARAKSACVNWTTMDDIIRDIQSAKNSGTYQSICWRECRKVEWYSEPVKRELGQIVGWINSLSLGDAEKTVAAVALSQAARKASFCRNGRWKLHRLPENQRITHDCSAWKVFEESLRYVCNSVSNAPPLLGNIEIVCGQTQKVIEMQQDGALKFPVDLILTSPPYGDSKTTVQYGSASSLCLDVISQLDGLENLYVSGAKIDAMCLGGRHTERMDIDLLGDIRKYWAGSKHSKHVGRVSRFLMDFRNVLKSIDSVLGSHGKIVLVLGRRSVAGFRVKIDIYAADFLGRKGYIVESSERRKFRQKRMPKTINKYGKSKDAQLRKQGTTRTMDEEIVLVLSRKH